MFKSQISQSLGNEKQSDENRGCELLQLFTRSLAG
jgi:hypothetical protein